MNATRHAGDRCVVVVRHAKSSWDDPSLGDHDRPLAPRGRKALPLVREHLAQLARSPALVLCSSARRTRETLDGIRPALADDVRIEIDDRLYGASGDGLLAFLRDIDDGIACVLLIGHNPGMADLIELLVERREGPAVEEFPTAAVAVLSFVGRWRTLGPTQVSLESLWTPRHGLTGTGRP